MPETVESIPGPLPFQPLSPPLSPPLSTPLSPPSMTSSVPAVGGQSDAPAEAKLARYLVHLGNMSTQLRQTSAQIEESVVEVCNSFQGIATRARETVARTTGFLSQEGDPAGGKQSFEHLIQNCGGTLVNIMNRTAKAGELSRRAIERVQQMDKASQMISTALTQLEAIANANKMLALNARIEAAHAGHHGAGFAVVAVEVASQTQESRRVTTQVSGLVENLRTLAESTLTDLHQMNQREQEQMEQCRQEVEASLRDLQSAHGEMKEMLTGMTEDGAMLARDIGSAVRGMQFQDRVSQRIAHVVEDLEILQAKLADHSEPAGDGPRNGPGDGPAAHGFSAYTMREERAVAGGDAEESGAGEVELF